MARKAGGAVRRVAGPEGLADFAGSWGRPALVAAGTTIVLGVAILLGSGTAGGLVIPIGLVAAGVTSAFIARRAADLLGLLAGSIVVYEAVAAVEVIQHGGPIATFGTMLGLSLVPGLFAVLVGLAVMGTRRGVRWGLQRLRLRSAPLEAAAVLLSLAGLAWIYILVAGSAVHLDSFHVTGDREIAVTVVGGSSSWCRVTDVRETDADVTVGAACVSLTLGPSLAAGVLIDLTVELEQPLGDRVVRDQDGGPVRMAPRP